MIKKSLLIYLIIVVFFFWHQNNRRLSNQEHIMPIPYNAATEKLEGKMFNPLVNKNNEFDFFNDGKTILKIKLMEKYSLTAMVVGKKNYSSAWNSKVVPYDFALIWGRLMDPDCRKTVKYSQYGRWYYYHWNDKFPLDQEYIISHSSNNHIIPANKNILKALEAIKPKQMAYFEGYLVNLDGIDKNNTVWWHSSLSRNDRGNGACELFYVYKVIFKDKTYL